MFNADTLEWIERFVKTSNPFRLADSPMPRQVWGAFRQGFFGLGGISRFRYGWAAARVTNYGGLVLFPLTITFPAIIGRESLTKIRKTVWPAGDRTPIKLCDPQPGYDPLYNALAAAAACGQPFTDKDICDNFDLPWSETPRRIWEAYQNAEPDSPLYRHIALPVRPPQAIAQSIIAGRYRDAVEGDYGHVLVYLPAKGILGPTRRMEIIEALRLASPEPKDMDDDEPEDDDFDDDYPSQEDDEPEDGKHEDIDDEPPAIFYSTDWDADANSAFRVVSSLFSEDERKTLTGIFNEFSTQDVLGSAAGDNTRRGSLTLMVFLVPKNTREKDIIARLEAAGFTVVNDDDDDYVSQDRDDNL